MTDKAMMDGNLQGHRFYGSPYAPNLVCRSRVSNGLKGGARVLLFIPMGCRSKGLGYLGTRGTDGTDGTDYSHCYLLAKLNTTSTYALVSHMR